jgi:hypothetical protein
MKDCIAISTNTLVMIGVIARILVATTPLVVLQILARTSFNVVGIRSLTRIAVQVFVKHTRDVTLRM